ncbi:MAG: DUF5946 family protein [Chloroflexi bacterium]|nr:DUF5946 family protein [Chloroflexota bacterium]
MDTNLTNCFSCGAMVPNMDGPTHRYMLSSPGCWSVYGVLLARDYGEYNYPTVYRLSVDAYTVQHPGRPNRQAIQSVAVHLIALYYLLEKGLPEAQVIRTRSRAAQFSDQFFWLEPPTSMGPITIVNAADAEGLEEYQRVAREWAKSAWEAWRAHHDQIRKWAAL